MNFPTQVCVPDDHSDFKSCKRIKFTELGKEHISYTDTQFPHNVCFNLYRKYNTK